MGALSFRAMGEAHPPPQPDACGANLFGANDRRRRGVGTLVAVVALAVLVAVALASCGGSAPSTSVPAGVDRSLPPSTYAAQEAVLKAWIAGERQFYAYMDEPDAPVLRELAQGMSAAEVFPNAQRYATGASLASELSGLQQMKEQHLIGPKTYHLGTPRITRFSEGQAVVSWCATDSGTTTMAGAPGPLTLDGGTGGARGITMFQIVGRAWKAAGEHSVSVVKC